MFAVTRTGLMRRVTPGALMPIAAAGSSSMTCLLSAAALRRFIAERQDIRNLAVIAHVDHGKTTLVDGLLKYSGTLKDARGRVMDSNDQEKERGITILAKNTAIAFPDGRRVNIVDTPGHLDFSGEVERALQMVEGFILLVDAAEGVKPGTRYVLRKALTLGLHPIVCINKIDKEDERIDSVVEQVQELFLETAISDDQLDVFFLFGSGRDGYFNYEPKKGGDLVPLFDSMFAKIPAPKQQQEIMPFQMLVSLVDDQPDGQKIAIGRIYRGSVKPGDVVKVALGDAVQEALVKDLRVYRGVEQEKVPEAKFGDVVWMLLKEPLDKKIPLKIGATVCCRDNVVAWPYRPPDQPTFSLKLTKNEASWAGKETTGNAHAKFIELRETLRKEALVNTALQIENLDTDEITLRGRGPLHLSVLIEGLRRKGYEFELRAPDVVRREVDGVMCEPFERLTFEYPIKCGADIISLISNKHGEVIDVKNIGDDRVQTEAVMPVRLMTDLSTRFNKVTSGRGVLNHVFDGYKPEVPVDSERDTGCLIAQEEGIAEQYSLAGLNGHGRFFVQPGEQVYFGQIVGENLKVLGQDVPSNVTKKNEQAGGMRANAHDKAMKRGTTYDSTQMGLEEYLAWVNPNELVTVTPKSIRIRKPGFSGKTTQRRKKN
jgi:GTP-binding protein